MSARLSVRDISTQALRAIGYLSINETAPDLRALELAAEWVDINVAHIAGTQRCLWLVENIIRIRLEDGISAYSLNATNLSAETNATLSTEGTEAIRVNDVGINGVQFPVGAYARRDEDDPPYDHPVTLIRRWEFDAEQYGNRAGVPVSRVFITRAVEPIAYVLPVPNQGGYSLYIRVQTFHPRLDDIKREQGTRLSEAWNKWLIMETAYSLGTGPLVTLPEREQKQKRDDAAKLKDELLYFNNDDHYAPRITRAFW